MVPAQVNRIRNLSATSLLFRIQLPERERNQCSDTCIPSTGFNSSLLYFRNEKQRDGPGRRVASGTDLPVRIEWSRITAVFVLEPSNIRHRQALA